MNPTWQASCATIQESILHLLLSKEFSDVVFAVGENKEKVHAHKLILMARSPVFAALFSERWANETETNGDGDVEGIPIPDVSAEIFNLFLKYLYSNEFSCQNLEEASGVLCVAHKYDVNGLEDKCSSILKAGIAVSNAINFHQLALILDLQDLTKVTEKFILRNALSVFSNDQFLETRPDALAKFLSSDDLYIDEIVAFHALMKWAENSCKIQGLDCTGENKRECLGDLLYLIRFPIMTMQEFADVVVVGNAGILSAGEVQDIFVHFSSGLDISNLPVLPFNSKTRSRVAFASIMPYKEPSVSEEGIIWDATKYGDWDEEFLFYVYRDICITEVEIYPLFLSSTTGQITQAQHFDVTVEISSYYGQDKLGCTRNEGFDKTCSGRIQFGEGTGVSIPRNTYYRVRLTIKGGSFVTMHQKEPEMAASVSFTPRGEEPVNFNLYPSSYNREYTNLPRASVAVGQIKAIHFCTSASLSK